MKLPRSHPALGAFRKKHTLVVRWEPIADELYHGLKRRMDHLEPINKRCQCMDHLAMYVYEDAKQRPF